MMPVMGTYINGLEEVLEQRQRPGALKQAEASRRSRLTAGKNKSRDRVAPLGHAR